MRNGLLEGYSLINVVVVAMIISKCKLVNVGISNLTIVDACIVSSINNLGVYFVKLALSIKKSYETVGLAIGVITGGALGYATLMGLILNGKIIDTLIPVFTKSVAVWANK